MAPPKSNRSLALPVTEGSLPQPSQEKRAASSKVPYKNHHHQIRIPHRRRGPTLLQAVSAAGGTVPLAIWFLKKANTFATDQGFEGSAYLNNGTYPAILLTTASGLLMLMLIAMANPPLFDWISSKFHAKQALNERTPLLVGDGVNSEPDDISLVSSTDDAGNSQQVPVSHPYVRNMGNMFWRGLAMLAPHISSFLMVAVLPAGDAALRFALAKYWKYTDDQADAACQQLATTGIVVIPILQLSNMLASYAVWNHTDQPLELPKRATKLQKIDHWANQLFSNMNVVHHAASTKETVTSRGLQEERRNRSYGLNPDAPPTTGATVVNMGQQSATDFVKNQQQQQQSPIAGPTTASLFSSAPLTSEDTAATLPTTKLPTNAANEDITEDDMVVVSSLASPHS